MNTKYYDFVVGSFVAVLLISNVVSAKILKFGPFTFDGGTILFPLAYIFGDVFTEVYGYKRARKIIWIGFFANLLMAAVFVLVGKLPPAPFALLSFIALPVIPELRLTDMGIVDVTQFKLLKDV